MGLVKVILREDIPRLGDAGDLVGVKPGYARNYLIPNGIAIPATAEKVQEVEHHRRLIAERQIELLKDLKGAAKKIREMELTFEAAAGGSAGGAGGVSSPGVPSGGRLAVGRSWRSSIPTSPVCCL